MSDDERAVIEAAKSYVAAKRHVRDKPEPLADDEPTALQSFFAAEGTLFNAVDALPQST